MRYALAGFEEADDDEDLDDAVDCAGELDDEDDDQDEKGVDDKGAERDACLRPFGVLELRPEEGIVGWQWINELLTCVRTRGDGQQDEAIRRLRAQIESLRCDCARDLAVHAMASSIAEYALGELEGLAARVDQARVMHDSAFMAAGAMMIAIQIGDLAAARSLARDSVRRYPRDAIVLRQAGNVYQAVCEFREAIEVLSTLFDIAERAGASWHLKTGLASEIEEIGGFLERTEARGVDETVFARGVDLAICMARERGFTVLGVAVSSLYPEAEGIDIRIDGSLDDCRALYHDLCDAYIDRCGEEAYYRLLLSYLPRHYEGLGTQSESNEGDAQ
jgi:tetratricopeptide (TPR) repeat protein